MLTTMENGAVKQTKIAKTNAWPRKVIVANIMPTSNAQQRNAKTIRKVGVKKACTMLQMLIKIFAYLHNLIPIMFEMWLNDGM